MLSLSLRVNRVCETNASSCPMLSRIDSCVFFHASVRMMRRNDCMPGHWGKSSIAGLHGAIFPTAEGSILGFGKDNLHDFEVREMEDRPKIPSFGNTLCPVVVDGPGNGFLPAERENLFDELVDWRFGDGIAHRDLEAVEGVAVGYGVQHRNEQMLVGEDDGLVAVDALL